MTVSALLGVSAVVWSASSWIPMVSTGCALASMNVPNPSARRVVMVSAKRTWRRRLRYQYPPSVRTCLPGSTVE